MFLFSEDDENIFIVLNRKKSMKTLGILWLPKEDNFHRHHQLWFKRSQYVELWIAVLPQAFYCSFPHYKSGKVFWKWTFFLRDKFIEIYYLASKGWDWAIFTAKSYFYFQHWKYISVESYNVQKDHFAKHFCHCYGHEEAISNISQLLR